MDIIDAVGQLDNKFKQGLLSASDYAWELQLVMQAKCEELRTTYTVIYLTDGEVCGKFMESTLPEVKEIVRCYVCLDDPNCLCDTDGFLSELQATGRAVRVDHDPFGTAVITAYRNKD